MLEGDPGTRELSAVWARFYPRLRVLAVFWSETGCGRVRQLLVLDVPWDPQNKFQPIKVLFISAKAFADDWGI